MLLSAHTPKTILNNIIKMLLDGVKNRNHSFHTPIFSNINLNNQINSRTVVLRRFDNEKNCLYFHTDFRSTKVKEIINKPNTYFVFYSNEEKIQLRIKTISKIHHNNSCSLEAWQKTKLPSRKCYLAKKNPGSKSKDDDDSIPKHLMGIDPNKEESEQGYKNFALIESKIDSFEWLYLSSKGHKRLLINLIKNKKKYQWLIP
tara:strand:+ start:502 stop:1107 length:606 start_codon:yes stop_codon:yes gene_type:complete